MSAAAGLDAARLVRFHDECLASPGWPRAGAERHAAGAWHWAERNHRFNALLWDEEDLARRRDVADAEIAANKRAIDGFNQSRNDAVERLDEIVLAALGTAIREDARLHSETPGMMADRLSILALKIRAMRAQTGRRDAAPGHADACRAKLARLEEQRGDLARCLDELLADCASGRARFKIYRQFKMYNDPAYR